MTSPQDDLLLLRVAAGDPAARRACVDRFGGLVWSLARRHSPNQADAEDAVQEIFVDLLRSADRFDPARSTEAGFVAMIARRRLIDLARRRAVRGVSEQADLEAASGDRIEERVDASKVARALAELPSKEREILVLVTYEGLSQQEVAERTGLPLGTVKTYARRGLMRVREVLAGEREAKGVAREVES